MAEQAVDRCRHTGNIVVQIVRKHSQRAVAMTLFLLVMLAALAFE
jgi:hypothetical protein